MFFDQNKQLSGWATEIFSYFKSSETSATNHLGDLGFADSKEAAGLQAADLVCYELTQVSKRRNYPTYVLDEAGKRGASIRLFEKTGLELLLGGCPLHLRSSFPTPDPSG
jgi:hypothetical protein